MALRSHVVLVSLVLFACDGSRASRPRPEDAGADAPASGADGESADASPELGPDTGPEQDGVSDAGSVLESDGGESGCEDGQLAQARARYETVSVGAGQTCNVEVQHRACVGGVWSEWSGSFAHETCEPAAPAACDGVPSGAAQARTRFASAQVPFGTECTSEVQERTCRDGSWSAWSGTYGEDSCVNEGLKRCDGKVSGTVEARYRYTSENVPYQQSCSFERQVRTCSDGTWSAWSGTFAYQSCQVLKPRRCDGTPSGGSQARVRYREQYVFAAGLCEADDQVRHCHDGTWSEWYTRPGYSAETCSVVQCLPDNDSACSHRGQTAHCEGDSPAQYRCMCDALYQGDGKSCWFDKCQAGTHECSPMARCIFLGGAEDHRCECPKGFRSTSPTSYSSQCSRDAVLLSSDVEAFNVLAVSNASEAYLLSYAGRLQKRAADGALLWEKQLETSTWVKQTVSQSVAVAPDGHVLVGGSSHLAVHLMELDEAGQVLFDVALPNDYRVDGEYRQKAHVLVAISEQGEYYVGGDFFGSLTLGGRTLTGANATYGAHGTVPGGDLFVAKLQPGTGDVLWSRRTHAWGEQGLEVALGLHARSPGVLLTANVSKGGLMWGDEVSAPERQRVESDKDFVALLQVDGLGTLTHTALVPGHGDASSASPWVGWNEGNNAFIDAPFTSTRMFSGLGRLKHMEEARNGGAYVVGDQSVDFGEGRPALGGLESMGIARLDSQGKTLWFHAAVGQRILDIAVGPQDALFVLAANTATSRTPLLRLDPP